MKLIRSVQTNFPTHTSDICERYFLTSKSHARTYECAYTDSDTVARHFNCVSNGEFTGKIGGSSVSVGCFRWDIEFNGGITQLFCKLDGEN